MEHERIRAENEEALEQPRQHIDIDDAHELRYWIRELSVTEQELRTAVRSVGPRVEDVRRQLTRSRVSGAAPGSKPGP